MRIKSNQTILFIGDSITDCGRRGMSAPLGDGYVKLFADMLAIRHPAKKVTVINKGIGGDKVTGLRTRWNDDVIRHRPDWLSIKIGINDLHSVLRQDPEPVPPRIYEGAYREVIERTRDAFPSCRLLLIDPFYISTDISPTSFRGDVNRRLPEYLRVVASLGRAYGALHVKTHGLFQRLLKHHEPDMFCAEPVHPNLTGHLVIADAVYAALGA